MTTSPLSHSQVASSLDGAHSMIGTTMRGIVGLAMLGVAAVAPVHAQAALNEFGPPTASAHMSGDRNTTNAMVAQISTSFRHQPHSYGAMKADAGYSQTNVKVTSHFDI